MQRKAQGQDRRERIERRRSSQKQDKSESQSTGATPSSRPITEMDIDRQRASLTASNATAANELADMVERGDSDISAQLVKIMGAAPFVAQCSFCGDGDRPEQIIVCDTCPLLWHIQCTVPKLKAVPTEDWSCPRCKDPDFKVPFAPGGAVQNEDGEDEEEEEEEATLKRGDDWIFGFS